VLTDRFSSKITGSLKYNYNAYRPDLNGQQEAVVGYNRHNGSVVIEYIIASNFVVDVELGESWTDYATGYNSQRPFWNVGADYTFKFISDTSIGIDFSRSVIDSLTSGASRNRRGDLFFRTGDMLKLTVNPYFIEDTFFNTDRKDSIKGMNVDVSRPLGSKVTLLLNALWEDQVFLPEGEEVQRYGLGCSFDYRLTSQITTGIGYRYNKRNSNIAAEYFTNNIGWLQARVSF
jgi:hypothetical protein